MKAKRILASVLSVALLLQLSPLGVLALDEGLPQTPQVSTVQENLDPTPTEEPALVAEPAPTAESIPEETAAPTATPTPEPTAEPTATPAPEETAAPDAAETPAPEPSAEPTAAPDPAAEVQAMIDALPDEVTEDNAEAVEQALTDIDDAKESLTDDELAGLDLTRYDAAANALLTLWGEAPADAVELLDDAAAPTQDGEGYYLIADADQLRWFADQVNNKRRTNISAKLTADITINSQVLDDTGELIADHDNLKSWTPIYNFEGEFDGNGHTIRGLYSSKPDSGYVGLFGTVGAGGTVKNVTLADSYVSGSRFVGGICGRNNGGTVEGCRNAGTVSGGSSVGGVCGQNNGTLQKSCNTGMVTGNQNVGGVCGWNKSTLQECYNEGNVTGTGSNVGGVCGYNGSGTLQDCYNIGVVTGTSNVGGVCGQNGNIVNRCYNIGGVSSTSGSSSVGAVCGGEGLPPSACYYLNISATSAGGGISQTEAEFKSGYVAYQLQGLLGEGSPQVWGQRIGTDPYPVFSSETAYTVYLTAPGSPCPGYSNRQDDYRKHDYTTDGVCSRCGKEAEAPQNSSDGYYEIYDQWQLYWFAKKVRDGNPGISARLMDNITLNEGVLTNGELNTGANFTPWTPIGTFDQPFTGTFDGDGHTISGLYIDGNTNYVGLFGHVGKDGTVKGTVKNVNITDSYMSGSSYVGGICGNNIGGTLEDCTSDCTVKGTDNAAGGICGLNENYGSVLNCHNTGKVTGSFNVGGVCGRNYSSGTVNGCYNTGEVSGTRWVGGVCGNNYGGTVKGCYNIGNVSGNSEVGGVCGWNYIKTLENSYNIGNVSGNSEVGGVCGKNDSGSTVKGCYYLDTSAETSDGGTPKTAAEFRSGDVAFCLQNDLGGATVPQVWGQRIDPDDTGKTDKTPVLNSTSAYTVYKAAENSPCKRYSNTSGQTFNKHEYDDEHDVCIRCGAWQEATLNGDYYEIHNQGQLRWFADQVNNNGRTNINARLTASFTMDSTEWTLIGKESQPFKGTFDGNGKTITGLKCTDTSKEYVGLFGYASGATIQNVTVKDATFNGNGFIGGVCGYIVGGAITGCTTSGGTVSGSYYIGGIAGYANNATVQRCVNSGKVTGSDSIGGIAGTAYQATVQDCGNTGAVIRTAATGNYGGIVGTATNAKAIQNCYNAYSDMAYPICATPDDANLSNCYYPVSSSSYGYDGTTAKTAEQFASGEVAYLLQKPLDDAAEAGTTAEQVWGQKIGTDDYPKLGGDKVYQTTPCTAGYSNTAQQTLDHSYTTGGVCSRCGEWQEAKQAADGYYEIHNQGQLRWFAELVNKTASDSGTKLNARLMNDITINSKVLDDKGELISDTGNLKSWTPIGKNGNSFKGEFDGSGHTIRGLYFNDTNKGDVGLFGFVGAGGTVKNVTLADSYVSGSWYVGGICGQNYGGTVEGCRNTGRVYGTRQFVGGVCGHNEGTLQKSCNTGIVYGYQNVGGVCGYNKGTLQECYNTGTVTGTENVGGVCGKNDESTLQECYNIGTVSGTTKVGGVCGLNYSGTVRNCYYLDTSATTADSGISKTAAEFKSGEVAYLLQKAINDAATEGTPAEQVWGQTLTEPNKQNYPVLGGDKVYRSTPCPTDYSNGESKIKDHSIGTDGYCTVCKELCIAYTVTIPATVELGNAANATATISAENVTLPTDKTLKVTVDGPFTATLVGKTDVTAQYTIQKDGTALESGDPVLTAQNGESPKIPLTFVKPDAAPYAGSYTGTVTFTVSVGDKTPTT